MVPWYAAYLAFEVFQAVNVERAGEERRLRQVAPWERPPRGRRPFQVAIR